MKSIPSTSEKKHGPYVRTTTRPKPFPFDPTRKWAIAQSDNVEWLEALEPESVQCFILDGPYNVNFKYNTFKDQLPTDVYIKQQLNVLRLAKRALKPGGSIFTLNYPDNASRIFAGAESFLNPVRQIAWVYNTQCASYPLRRAHRTWLWFSKGKTMITAEGMKGEYISVNDKRVKEKMANGDRPQRNDWFQTPQVGNMSKERRSYHPCQVPQEQVEDFIKATTNPGDLVADCFLGSATTALAALKVGRRFIGCDMDPLYVQKAEELLLAMHGAGSQEGKTGIVSTARSFAVTKTLTVPNADGGGDIKGLLNVDQLLAPPDEQPQPLVESFFRKTGIGIISGQPSANKTWIQFDLAWAVTTGSLWMEKYPVARTGALVFDLEMETDEVQDRFQQIYKARIQAGKPQDLHVISGQTFDLTSPESAAEMERAIAKFRPGLVIMDPWVNLARISESNNRQVADVMEILGGWVKKYQCYILLAAHTAKDTKKGIRGGSAIEGAARTIMSVYKGRSGVSQVHMTKTRAFRWEEEDKTFHVSVSNGRVFVTDQPFEPAINVVTATQVVKPKVSDQKRATAREVIMKALEQGKGQERAEIWEQCRRHSVSMHFMDGMLSTLVDEGEVRRREVHTGKRGGKRHVYSLAKMGVRS